MDWAEGPRLPCCHPNCREYAESSHRSAARARKLRGLARKGNLLAGLRRGSNPTCKFFHVTCSGTPVTVILRNGEL